MRVCVRVPEMNRIPFEGVGVVCVCVCVCVNNSMTNSSALSPPSEKSVLSALAKLHKVGAIDVLQEEQDSAFTIKKEMVYTNGN